MPRFTILTSLNKDEDEDELTPSQVASKKEKGKQKAQRKYKVLKGLNDFQEKKEVEQPKPEPAKEKPSFKKRVKEFVSGVFKGEEKPKEELPEFETAPLDELTFEKPAIRIVDDEVVFQTADIEGVFLRNLEADRQETTTYDSMVGEVGGALIAGTGDVITGTGQAARWLGYDQTGDRLVKKGGEFRVFAPTTPKELEEFNWKDLTNPRFWTTQAARGVPFTLATLPMFYAGAYVTGAAVTATGISGISALVLKTVGASFLPTVYEAAVEAGGVYDEALDRGKSKKEADSAADKTFKGTVSILGVSNTLQFLPFLRATKADDAIIQRIISSNQGWIKRAGKGIGVAGLEIATEGLEEVLQEKVSTEALGDKFSFLDPETQRTFALGGVQGLIFTTGGVVIDATTGLNRTKEFTEIGIEDARNTINEIEDRVIEETGSQEEVSKKGREEVLEQISKDNPEVVERITKEVVSRKIAEEEANQPKEAVEPAEPTKREIIKVDKAKYEGVTAAQAVIRPDKTAALDIEMSEAARGKNQGTQITRELEQKLLDKEITNVVLPSKEEAVVFWEKMGYEKTGEIENGIQQMTKTLSKENLPKTKKPEKLQRIDEYKVGGEIKDVDNNEWLITEVLDKGKFKATPKAGVITETETKIEGGKLLMKNVAGEFVKPFAYTFQKPKEIEPAKPPIKKPIETTLGGIPLDEAIAKAKKDIQEAKQTIKESPERKADMEKYIKEVQAWIAKKTTKPVPKKPLAPRRKPRKKKKVKVPKKKVEKPRQIELSEVKPQKKRVFMVSKRKALQEKVGSIIAGGKTQKETIENIDNFLTETFNQADDPLYERKLKAIRTELKRSMYEMVGATTGNWKKDYAYFQRLRSNPDVADVVDRIEDGIFQIDDIVSPTVSAPEGLATTGSRPIGEFETRAKPKKDTDEFKLFEKVKELTQKYAKLIGEGYLPRKSLGVYYPKTKNVFVNALNDLSVATHEITHFLDKTHNLSDKLLAIKGRAVNGNPIYDSGTLKYRKAITDLYVKYYAGGKPTHRLRKRALEGFATLLQKYVESPQTITEEYPLLVNAFLKKGGKYYHPVIGEIIKDLNEIISEYQGLNSLDKIGARVVTGDAKVDKDSFLNRRQRLRAFLADGIYPTEVLAKESGRHFTKKDTSLWLRAYNNVSGIVNNNIHGKKGYWRFVNGDIKKTQDFNWKNLYDTLGEKKLEDDFDFYLVARREHFTYMELAELKEKFEQEIENLKETPKDQRTTKDQDGLSPLDRARGAKVKYQELKELLARDGFLREEVDKAYTENKDRFVDEEKMFDVLVREDLKFMADSQVQLLTPKKYKQLIGVQGYASFKRQFYNEVVGENNEFPIQTRVGKNKVSSLLRRKGSQQAIISPLNSGVLNHSEMARKGLRQIVYNSVTDIGISATFPNLFQELQLKTAVDPRSGALWYPQEKDPNIIMGRSNYKRKPVLVDAEIKNVLDNVLTYQNIDTFVRLYTGLSRLFTAGTTGYYPPFAVVNLVRDQITAQANTVNKYKTLYSPIVEFGRILKDKNSKEYGFYQEYLVLGGERQTFTGWQRLPPDKLAKRIRDERGGLKKTIALMQKGTDVLSVPAKYSEIVTRASEYIKARKAGKPTIVALEEAGRLTAPFHHLGSWGGKQGQTFIRGIPYFNAALQVLDQHARVAATPDGRKRMLFVLTAITAAYMASMLTLLRAPDEQKEQYKDLKPEDLARYLYFPNPTGKKLIRIPMSEVFTPAGTIFNMIIADHFMKAKYTQADYIHAATAILPDQFDPTEPIRAFLSWIPQVFKRGVEVAVGVKTYPEVSSLESQGLKNLPPELRTNRNTSAFAKWLGKKVGWSPIKIDYFITGYVGRGANIALGKPNAWNFKGSVLREYWFSNGRRVSGTYDLREENDQKYNAYQRGEIELSKKERDKVYGTKILMSKFSDLMGEFRELDMAEKEQEATELRTEIILFMDKIERGDKPKKGDLPKTYKSFNDWTNKAEKRRKEKMKELGR